MESLKQLNEVTLILIVQCTGLIVEKLCVMVLPFLAFDFYHSLNNCLYSITPKSVSEPCQKVETRAVKK